MGRLKDIPKYWGGLLKHISPDLAALAAAVNELKAKLNATNAKLDADAGVADSNYAANNATFPDVAIKTK